MQGLVFDIEEFALYDGPGIRSVVFPLSLNRYVPFLYASIAASANAHIPALRAAHACYAVRPDAFELQGPI